MTHFTVDLQQQGFRWRNDDGSESAASWKSGLNAPIAVRTNDEVRIRFLIQEVGGASTTASTFKLQYIKNGGSLVDITNSSTDINIFDSTHLTDADDTTQQIGSGTFVSTNAGVNDDDIIGLFGDVDFASNDEVELEVTLRINGAIGDEFQIRVIGLGDTVTVVHRCFVIISGNPVAYNTIVEEETHVAVDDAVSSLTLPEISGGTDMLYVMSVAIRGSTTVSSISGGSLTWTLRKRQSAGRGTGSVEVWTADGSPSAFSAAITMSGSTTSLNGTLIRYSGADMTTPIEDAVGHNTNGENGASTGGTDDDTPELTTGSTNADSVHYVALYTRNEEITTGDGDYLKRMYVAMEIGLSGDKSDSYVEDNNKTSTGDDA